MPADDLAVLLEWSRPRVLKKGEVLLREGDVCRSLYWVEQGYLRTWYNKDGVDINLHFTFEGGVATNMKSVKSRHPSDRAIEAGEAAVVWEFHLDSILPEHKVRHGISQFFRKVAMRVLLAAQDQGDLLKIYTPAERYAYIEENNPLLLQRVSLSQIASYLGVARETLSRIRAQRQ